MAKALLVIDVQVDFCESGALACDGGALAAKRISEYLKTSKSNYDFVIASRDWHTPGDSNGGHFPPAEVAPDLVNNWPLHCIAGEKGAEYHENFDSSLVDIHIKKGQGSHGYSIFDGTTEDGEEFSKLIQRLGINSVDVVGIATDYCVRASSIDSKHAGLDVRVITSLTAGVAQSSIEAAIDEMVDLGISVVPTP